MVAKGGRGRAVAPRFSLAEAHLAAKPLPES
jgi:hypothetical protein